MSINYQDKFYRLTTLLAHVITFLHHSSAAHAEIANKIKPIRAMGYAGRINGHVAE